MASNMLKDVMRPIIEAQTRERMEVSYNTDRNGFCTHCGADIKIGVPFVIVKSCFRLKGEHWYCKACFRTMLAKANRLAEEWNSLKS